MLGKSSKDQESEGGTRATTVKGPGGASLISRDLRIVGDCVSDGRLRIEGTVTGDVTAAGLEVSPSGSVEGDVTVRKGGSSDTIVIDGSVKGAVRGARVEVGKEGRVDGGLVATEAVVEGHVKGGILAEQRLILEETAEVEGDVRARRLALKEGGQVNGNIRMGDRATEGTSSEIGSGVGKKASSAGDGEGRPGSSTGGSEAKGTEEGRAGGEAEGSAEEEDAA
ncbi:MAG: polymer-forming cytoskeletal protein [Longimicrobiales bacterium]|nr:polymer-forming cytoskeletal protein [Longimicrobiales bacterium]